MLKLSDSRKAKISVSLLDLNVMKITTQYGDMSLVKPDLSEITIPPIFCGCLREKNTHLEHLDDTTDRYDTSWKVVNTSNCILIYNVGSQKRYNMDFF